MVQNTERVHNEDAGSTMRIDAERNHERIMAAARRLYALDGLDVSMSAIAREAGVGKATLYRHFATPQRLIDAVFVDQMNAYVQATAAALANNDPWQGFIGFIWDVCEMQAQDRGFASVLTLSFPAAEALETHRQEAFHGFLQIIDRAKTTRFLRSDFRSEDLVLLLMANAGVISATANDAPDSWRRLVGQMLRGFASPDAPLPTIPEAPSSQDLYHAMARGNLTTR